MKVKVIKIKRAQFEPIQIEVERGEKTAKDKDGNVLFAIFNDNEKYVAHANGSDIKFDWFMDRTFDMWRKVVWG